MMNNRNRATRRYQVFSGAFLLFVILFCGGRVAAGSSDNGCDSYNIDLTANRENNGSFLVLPGVWQELA